MRYLLQQKIFSFGDDFTIRDDGGADAFYVDGKVFSLGDSLSFQDMNGNELAQIRQKLLSWGPTYEISRGGETLAIVKKTLFTFFRCEFSVDVPGPDDLVATGDFLDREYSFERGGGVAAEVSKRWIALSDSYAVDVRDGEDEVLILASMVVIDLCCHGDKKR